VYVIAFGAAERGEMHLTRRRETEINVIDGLFVCLLLLLFKGVSSSIGGAVVSDGVCTSVQGLLNHLKQNGNYIFTGQFNGQ
jgi:hypothetical protein